MRYVINEDQNTDDQVKIKSNILFPSELPL